MGYYPSAYFIAPADLANIPADADAAVASLRTLGTSAAQASAGDHAHATLYDPRSEVLYLTPGAAVNSGTSAVDFSYPSGYGGADRWASILYDASTQEAASWNVVIPSHWVTTHVDVIWTKPVSSSGSTVVWQVSTSSAVPGDVLTSRGVVQTQVSGTSNQAELTQTRVGTGITLDPNTLLNVRITRVAADAADTLAQDAALFFVLLSKAT